MMVRGALHVLPCCGSRGILFKDGDWHARMPENPRHATCVHGVSHNLILEVSLPPLAQLRALARVMAPLDAPCPRQQNASRAVLVCPFLKSRPLYRALTVRVFQRHLHVFRRE